MALLKLDYDCTKQEMLKRFEKGLTAFKRVQESKIKTNIQIQVLSVERSLHGYHVKLDYKDDILLTDYAKQGMYKQEPELKYIVIIAQTILGSDLTRSWFDTRRVYKKEKLWNLMFNYKNGIKVTTDNIAKAKLQTITKRVFND